MGNKNVLRLLAVLLAFVLIAAACGDDDEPSAAGDDSGQAGDDGSGDDGSGDDGSGDDGSGDDGSGDDGSGDDGSADDSSGDDDSVTLSQGGTLAKVIDAGVVECGGNDTLPGFGIVDSAGAFSGFDIDFCKVIAAAVLGDAEAINVTPLVAAQRFPTLQSGEIDVLIRNTTWTASP